MRWRTAEGKLAWFASELVAQSLVQASLDFSGQRNRLRIAQNIYAFLGLIENHGAVLTVRKMALKLLHNGGIEFAVNVVRQLEDDAFAIQFGAP
jgi:hypothetical protein